MKRLLIASLALFTSLSAYALTGYLTSSSMITTISGRPGWRCVYNAGGHTVVQIFSMDVGSCPYSIEVE